ncbi:MAG: AraC family transcriptional regulator [Ruminococcaceae bacterium]|nr:AraC family transcriptional regulator [Oscillospiraceae bacterium]
MEKYEQHQFQQKELPVIFHLDFIGPNTSLYPHWHENIELLYCIHGDGEAVIDSRSVPLKKGGLTVVNSGNLHYTKVISGQSVVYYCLIVSSDMLEQFGIFVEHKEFCEFVCCEEINRRFEQIVKEMKEQKPYYEGVVKGEIGALVSLLQRDFSVESKGDKKSEMVKLGIRYMKKHFCETLSLNDIAEAVGFSRYYFCREFKNITGYTVNEYLRYLRCREADQLLQNSTLAISEIASACGFDDVSYFTKIFKKQTGKLPSLLRKERKGQQKNEIFFK